MLKRLIVLGAIAVAPAYAQERAVAVAAYRDWAVYTQAADAGTACYASVPSEDSAPRAVEHGDVYLFVTSFRNQRGNAQFSVTSTEVAFAANRTHFLKIGRQSWKLYAATLDSPRRGGLFAEDPDEAAIVRALERGSQARIEAVSDDNIQVVYYFSLSGSANAIDKARATCR